MKTKPHTARRKATNEKQKQSQEQSDVVGSYRRRNRIYKCQQHPDEIFRDSLAWARHIKLHHPNGIKERNPQFNPISDIDGRVKMLLSIVERYHRAIDEIKRLRKIIQGKEGALPIDIKTLQAEHKRLQRIVKIIS